MFTLIIMFAIAFYIYSVLLKCFHDTEDPAWEYYVAGAIFLAVAVLIKYFEVALTAAKVAGVQ